MALVTIEGLTKRFPKQAEPALRSVSTQIRSGHIVGLVGPDGSGKTTFLRLIAGLLRADEGGIDVGGFDPVANAKEVRARIAYMPQRFGLYEDLSVEENLNLYADLRGLVGSARKATFERLLDFTGLAPFTGRLAGALSGGMKQKLGLACALVVTPELLLLDEPSVGVDPISRRELWRMVSRLTDEGITVVWATAYLDEAEKCETVLVLSEGDLIFDGRPADLAARVDGRVFMIEGIEGDRRYVLNKARQHEAVMDGTIQASDVRLLLNENAHAPSLASIGAGDEARLQPVAPRFEDAFIDLIGGGFRAESPFAGGSERSHDIAIAVEARGLTRMFGSFTAASEISFDVRRGEVFGLIGPNGAGKSTTFKMLSGLLKPTSGEARIAGVDLRTAASEARARLGYMAQKFSLYGDLSTMQNLRFFARVYGLTGARQRTMIARMIESFALTDKLDENSGQLPLGFKQRLSLACAVMHEPDVLFLDDAAILINAERPELHTVDGARPVSLDHLLPRVSDCIDLGEGRALIRSPDGRAAFWNAAETVSWLGESVDADGATGILHRGNGALLANGELVIQKPDPADPTVEFSHYRETEGELALVSAQRGAWKPKPPAAPGSMEAMLPSLDPPFSHWQTLGDMVLSYSGTPARVALSDSGHEAGRWWMPLATTLTQMVTSADPDLGPYFPNLAYIASDGSHLIGATLGNGNFPTGKLPVKEEVHRLIVDRGAIMAVFGQGVERMIPRSSLLANLECVPLFDLASLLPQGNKGSIQQVAWLSNVGVGLALVNQGGTGTSRQLMAIAFCSHRGVLSQSLLPFSGPAIPVPSGFLFQDESGPRLVGFDEEAMKIDIGPAEKQIRLPVPLRETMEKIHGASEGGLRWSLSSHQDIDYRLDFDQFCVQLQSDRIVIDTLDAAQGQQPDVVLFPSGYRIIDAIEHGGEGSILVRAEELLQVIRFNSFGERGHTGATTYVAAERLFLHRMGLTELAAKLPALPTNLIGSRPVLVIFLL